jgi:fructokinase
LRLRFKVPCFPQKPVDTTGAGDGFWSGILFALKQKLDGSNDLWSLNERDLYQIGIIGNAVGTIATQGKGAIPCYPSLNELIRFLQSELCLPTNDYLAIPFEELDETFFREQKTSSR